jgi:hypothetical protein
MRRIKLECISMNNNLDSDLVLSDVDLVNRGCSGLRQSGDVDA